MIIHEEWRAVEGFPDYSVSNRGRLMRNETERIIRPQRTPHGACYVPMQIEPRRQVQRGLAMLVAYAFIPIPAPSFNAVIQLDGDRMNCDVDNLAWRPLWFSRKYHGQFLRRYAYPIEEDIVDLSTAQIYEGSAAVAMRFGLLERDIVQSIYNRTFVWPTYQQFGLLD